MAAAQLAAACGVIVIALGAVFVALLALTLAVTSDAHITAALKKGLDRGVLTRESYPPSPYGNVGHAYDMYTDCIAFSTNLNNADEGILRRIAGSPFVGVGSADKGRSCESLAAALEANAARANSDYLRFWHGYQVYTRAILSITSLDNLRRLTAVIFYGVLLFFVHQLARSFGPWTWPIVLLPFFIVGDFLVAPLIVSHAVPLIWIFLSATLVSIILERVENARSLILPVFVFSAGAITSFLSMLLNPPLAPALISFLVIASGTGRDLRETWQTVLYAGSLAVLWFAGYVLAWIQKWFFAALTLGTDAVISDLTSSVGKYEVLDTSQALGFLDATWRNLSPNWIFLAYVVISILVAVAIIAWVTRFRGGTKQDVWDFLAMLTPLLVIVAWVEANRSHSAMHVGFVNRSFVLFSVIPLLAAVLIWRRASLRQEQNAGMREPVAS